MVNLTQVYKIAHQVRLWAEAYQQTHSRKYYSNMCGLCAKASAVLAFALQYHNIPCCICSNTGHVFVLVDRVWIVDITATQFVRWKNQPIVILTVNEAKIKIREYTNRWYWSYIWKHYDVNTFILFQKIRDWHIEQRASESDIDSFTQSWYSTSCSHT